MAETLFLILVSIPISLLIMLTLKLFFGTRHLPPGPFAFPFIGSLVLLRNSVDFEATVRSLHSKLGPVITLYMGRFPFIVIADRTLAHLALIQNGAVFADRPPALAVSRILSSNQHNISSAPYGPTWRLLRRNLTSNALHPLKVKSYGHARKWVLQILENRIESQAKSGHPVVVLDHFQFSMFALLVLMCFGDKLDENQIQRIEKVQRDILSCYVKYSRLNFWPRLTRIFMRRKWEEFYQIKKKQGDILIPLIKAREKLKEKYHNNQKEHSNNYVLSYVDTLLDLELPEEKRKLNEREMVSLCSELLNAGTDTTSTVLQWIMANLMKFPQIQERIYTEIKSVTKDEEEVKEDYLEKMPYLKAVILEGLRRHPPVKFGVTHAATEDTMLDKYFIPKNGQVNFTIADIGLDPKVWDDPMAFKPERFLNNGGGSGFDVTGNKEIKMMPFGAGRRICPAYGLAMLHLEYFVANLIWKFEWKAVEGDDVDLSEKTEVTVVMKNPLQACISPRNQHMVK